MVWGQGMLGCRNHWCGSRKFLRIHCGTTAMGPMNQLFSQNFNQAMCKQRISCGAKSWKPSISRTIPQNPETQQFGRTIRRIWPNWAAEWWGATHGRGGGGGGGQRQFLPVIYHHYHYRNESNGDSSEDDLRPAQCSATAAATQHNEEGGRIVGGLICEGVVREACSDGEFENWDAARIASTTSMSVRRNILEVQYNYAHCVYQVPKDPIISVCSGRATVLRRRQLIQPPPPHQIGEEIPTNVETQSASQFSNNKFTPRRFWGGGRVAHFQCPDIWSNSVKVKGNLSVTRAGPICGRNHKQELKAQLSGC